MSTETNKAIVRQFFAALNTGNLGGIAALCAPAIVVHNVGAPDPLDLDGFLQLAGMFDSAFPGAVHTIEDIVAEDDRVVTRLSFQGVHGGDLMGIPPSGKSVAVSGVIIDKLAGGKIVETWRLFDQMGMMQQLGVIPAPEQVP